MTLLLMSADDPKEAGGHPPGEGAACPLMLQMLHVYVCAAIGEFRTWAIPCSISLQNTVSFVPNAARLQGGQG